MNNKWFKLGLLMVATGLMAANTYGGSLIISIQRSSETETATYGVMSVEGKTFNTTELPWRDNKPDVSRIPPGTYSAYVRDDNNKWRIELADVPGRTYIQIHKGSDPSQSKGCILVPGAAIEYLKSLTSTSQPGELAITVDISDP